MADAKPFKISVSDEAIRDLKQRLANTRWPEQPEDVGWQDGTPKGYLQVRPVRGGVCTHGSDMARHFMLLAILDGTAAVIASHRHGDGATSGIAQGRCLCTSIPFRRTLKRCTCTAC